MIARRTFLQAVALAVLAAPRTGEAGAAARRIPRVGIIGDVNPLPWTVQTPGVQLECRWADGRLRELPRLAAELVRREVDVIVTAGAAATQAARNATRTIPIVFVAGDEPRADRLLASAPRPDGNVTGLTMPAPAEVARWRLMAIGRAVPGLRRVVVLSDPDDAAGEHAVGHLHAIATRMAVEVRTVRARTAAEAEDALVAARRERVDGLLVLSDALSAADARRLVELAARTRLPAVYAARSFAEAGGLMALHGDLADVIRRTAGVVARVLAGTAPAALPVQPLVPLRLTLNLSTARTLGLALPPSLLAGADLVIGL